MTFKLERNQICLGLSKGGNYRDIFFIPQKVLYHPSIRQLVWLHYSFCCWQLLCLASQPLMESYDLALPVYLIYVNQELPFHWHLCLLKLL